VEKSLVVQDFLWLGYQIIWQNFWSDHGILDPVKANPINKNRVLGRYHWEVFFFLND
jgi:hypothetical protein